MDIKKLKIFTFSFLCIILISCKSDAPEVIAFNQVQWNTKEGKDYLYRPQMLNNVLYNDTIRSLNKEQIVSLLGNPDYTKENFMYYRIKEKRAGLWTLHTTTMVIKFKDETTIEWIKVHE